MHPIERSPHRNGKNRFYAKVLGSISVFSLVLVSLVFLMIYRTVKSRDLDQLYRSEQEAVTTISTTASIMQDTAESMLQQLNGNAKLSQLIYTMDIGQLSVQQALTLLQNLTRSSAWIDSIYIYNAKQNMVSYAYMNKDSCHHTFCQGEDFFDSAFLAQISNLAKRPTTPLMRTVQYRPELEEHTLFTYYLPVQNSYNSYDGFFVVNISADKLMELSYGVVSHGQRQIMILDSSGQFYPNNPPVLDESQRSDLLQQVFGSESTSGQQVSRATNTVFTWSQSPDTGLIFLSIGNYSDIASQLQALTRWFVLFYLAVLIFAAAAAIYLSKRINHDYAVLQNRYALAEQRYLNNFSNIKQTILRSFFTLKSTDFTVGKQFAENGIEVDQYEGYLLALFQLRHRNSEDADPQLPYRRVHFVLQEQLTQLLPKGTRFELIDMLQGRYLLVCEQTSVEDAEQWMRSFHDTFATDTDYTASGVYTIMTVEEKQTDLLPETYRTLSDQIEQLYFYPSGSLVSLSALYQRTVTTRKQVEQVRSEVIQALVSQRFEDATSILSNFFDTWFEPVNEAPYTIDVLLSGLSEYISTFKRSYAVTMDFSASRFRIETLRAESSRAVSRLFAELIQDISYAFASIGSRSNYIDELVHFMEEHYADPKLNVDVLADHVGLSVAHVQNIFKAATGSSISAYLRNLRLMNAANLLANTDTPISEIADATGFGNANYFYTVFKRHYSVTPTEYRANARN